MVCSRFPRHSQDLIGTLSGSPLSPSTHMYACARKVSRTYARCHSFSEVSVSLLNSSDGSACTSSRMRLSLISAGRFLARASQREKCSGRLVSRGDERTNPVSSEMSKSRNWSSVTVLISSASHPSFHVFGFWLEYSKV